MDILHKNGNEREKRDWITEKTFWKSKRAKRRDSKCKRAERRGQIKSKRAGRTQLKYSSLIKEKRDTVRERKEKRDSRSKRAESRDKGRLGCVWPVRPWLPKVTYSESRKHSEFRFLYIVETLLQSGYALSTDFLTI
jgi:hypothetical protein